MFTDNEKISQKQMNCILMLSVFTGSIFVLPYMLARMFGKNIVIGATLYVLVAAVYVGVVMFAGKLKTNKYIDSCNLQNKDKQKCCNNKKIAVPLIMIIRYFLRLIFYITLAVAVLTEGQVPFMEKKSGNSIGNLMILMPLLIVSLYGAIKNVEKQGRMSEMFILTAFFPYVIMVLFGLKEMDYKMLIPNWDVNAVMLLKCYALLACIVPIEIYPQLKCETIELSDNMRFLSVMSMVILSAILSILMAGIYGINGMKDTPMVSVSIMRYIELPLGVLQRFDVLMVWFFVTGIFVLLCGTLYRIGRQLSTVVSEKNSRLLLVLLALSSLLICISLPPYEKLVGPFIVYGELIDVPLSLIMLFVSGTRNKEQKKWQENNIEKSHKKNVKLSALILLSGISLLSLTGCSNDIENIEQRDYATYMMVIKGDDENTYNYLLGISGEHRVGEESDAEDAVMIGADNMKELSDKYGSLKGKDLSLSHLKVILTAVNNDALILGFDEDDEIAKTCPVLMVYDVKNVCSHLKNADRPQGTYIEDLIRDMERKDEDIPKVMDYLKQLRDKKAVQRYLIVSTGKNLKIKRTDV